MVSDFRERSSIRGETLKRDPGILDTKRDPGILDTKRDPGTLEPGVIRPCIPV